MSGSGGGGGGGGGDWKTEGPCEEFDHQTVLQSPNPDVVSRLKKGDKLRVQLEQNDERNRVVLTKDSDVAGSLVFRQLKRLIECLEEGHEFEAHVVEIAGANIKLRIRPK